MLNTKQLTENFIQRYGEANTAAYFCPGRVNLIGEHIDYNGGFVLPAAISLGITAIVNRREDAQVRIYSTNFNEEISFSIEDTFLFHTKEKTHWADYIKASLQVLKDNNVVFFGADILIGSDLPLGAGLSSSAALECLICYIFNEDFYSNNRTQLALDAQQAERHYVGVNCGIMDQFAVSNGMKNHAMLLNCATIDSEYVQADFKDFQLVIINSNKARALAESKYNERRKECDAAFEQLQKFDIAADLCHIHEISLGHLEDDILYQRAKHAILENKRVLHAVEALNAGQLEAFGALLVESHISLSDDYDVSCEELNLIVHYSMHFVGCVGARMTGAGFGGCCIALVKKDKIDEFISYVAKGYEQKSNLKADFYVCDIVNGVHRI